MLIPPKRIAMSGGGMLGLAHIGALEVLESEGLLRCVKEYIGISAGSMAAMSLCIGYTIGELHTINNGLDFTLIQNLDPEMMLTFMDSYGLDDGRNFDKLLSILLRAKNLSPEITFGEFARQFPENPQPRIIATNLQTCLKQEFSVKETPDVPMKFAVLSSACVPFLFTPMRDLSGNVFVDGGLVAFSPFNLLTDEERSETLAISFRIQDLFNKSSIGDGLLAYFKRLFFSGYHHQDRYVQEAWKRHIIYLDTGDAHPFDFTASTEKKEALFQMGRKGALEFLKFGVRSQRPARRNSSP